MKMNRFVAALLCASMGLAATATFAQSAPQGPGPYYNNDHGPDHRGGPDERDHGPSMSDRNDHGDRFDRNDRNDHFDHNAPRPPEHVDNGPRHDWRKGERISNDYRSRQYVIDNWHEHNLRQPPRGYQWVGVNGDYLLVAAASGIIAQIVMSH